MYVDKCVCIYIYIYNTVFPLISAPGAKVRCLLESGG